MVASRTVATVNVTVSRDGESMSKKTKVLIEPPAFIHVIQTDKPIYKPGQTGALPRVSSSVPLAEISITLRRAGKL